MEIEMKLKTGYLKEVKEDIKKNAKSFKFVDNKNRVVFMRFGQKIKTTLLMD